MKRKQEIFPSLPWHDIIKFTDYFRNYSNVTFYKICETKRQWKNIPSPQAPWHGIIKCNNKWVFEMKTIRNISPIIVSEVANTNIAKQCLECLKQKKQKIDINWNMRLIKIITLCKLHADWINFPGVMDLNPFTPKISLVIPLTVCHTILMMLVDIGLSNTSPNWYISSFSSPVCLILFWYCKEKFCLGHSWVLKG